MFVWLLKYCVRGWEPEGLALLSLHEEERFESAVAGLGMGTALQWGLWQADWAVAWPWLLGMS